MTTYTVSAETREAGAPHMNGKREWVFGVYVMQGNKTVRRFGGLNKSGWAKHRERLIKQATEWAAHCNAAQADGQRWAQ